MGGWAGACFPHTGGIFCSVIIEEHHCSFVERGWGGGVGGVGVAEALVAKPMCRAHSHAVPHTRTVEHDQHWQRSLQWMRKTLQNEEPENGPCELRLRFLQAEAMQAMQADASWPSAPHKPTSLIERGHQSDQCLPCHHMGTTTTRGFPKDDKQPTVPVVAICEQPGQGLTWRDITEWREPPT